MSTYENWTKEDLIRHIQRLESKGKSKERHGQKPFDFSSHPRRKIALKFSYCGWDYNGLAFQKDYTPLPTVEDVLFNALSKARLIDPQAGYDGCGWERCGRTDRGVSAAGQVISLHLRSSGTEGKEMAYPTIINRILPPTIRVIAWSPVSSTFSARFNCTYRHYKYFFSPQGLDIPRMQEAAKLLVGSHDFRNMCKVDPGKQITVFIRRILSASIDEEDGIHVLNLVGTAFLYHQVRHIMALLFLIGSGLEQPSIIPALLDVEKIDRKPDYLMADALPLTLYDCAYADGDVDWRIDGFASPGQGVEDGRGIYALLQSRYERSQIYTALNRTFFEATKVHYPPPTMTGAETILGGGTLRKLTQHIPLLDPRRPRLEPVDVINERWRIGKGARRAERQEEKAEVAPVPQVQTQTQTQTRVEDDSGSLESDSSLNLNLDVA